MKALWVGLLGTLTAVAGVGAGLTLGRDLPAPSAAPAGGGGGTAMAAPAVRPSVAAQAAWGPATYMEFYGPYAALTSAQREEYARQEVLGKRIFWVGYLLDSAQRGDGYEARVIMQPMDEKLATEGRRVYSEITVPVRRDQAMGLRRGDGVTLAGVVTSFGPNPDAEGTIEHPMVAYTLDKPVLEAAGDVAPAVFEQPDPTRVAAGKVEEGFDSLAKRAFPGGKVAIAYSGGSSGNATITVTMPDGRSGAVDAFFEALPGQGSRSEATKIRRPVFYAASARGE